MIPNDFGLIRQLDHTLLACLFPLIKDITEYDIELRYVKPDEWNLEYYYSSNSGAKANNPKMKCAIIDISRYSYLLIPTTTVAQSQSVYTGLGVGTDTGINQRVVITSGLGPVDSYTLVERYRSYKYASINERKEDNLPIIGFIRHRSDGVNPKGMIKDAISDILQPVKADEFDGETDRERDDLSSDIEGPDVDTGSDHRAADRANGQADG